jgi:NADPH-dependent glutamate synthase beta subunit-like oxidoreductase
MASILENAANNNRTTLPSGVEEHDLGYARPMRVVCIGAGASGLDIAYKIDRHLKSFSLQIYDKNPVLGGTWYENMYEVDCHATCCCVD